MPEGVYNCRVCKTCGGCQLAHLSYGDQLLYKQEEVSGLLSKFAEVEEIVGMAEPLRYRNKVQVSFGMAGERIIYGNYVASTHEIVEVEDCLLCDEVANDIIALIARLAAKYHISIFDEHSYRGCLRHVLVRSSKLNEYMVVLVTGSFTIPHERELIGELRKAFPMIKTVVQSINNRHTSMVLGERQKVLFGRGYIYDELCGLVFKLSAVSFYQVNKSQTEVLYNKALEFAGLRGDETVVDAYCGIGTISLCLAKRAKQVIGVELNRQAIADAVKNMHLNEVENAVFVSDDAGRFMSKMARERCHVDVVVMDPPRSGADKKFMDSVIRLRPEKIVYVSCNPVTLAANLAYFSRYYRVERICPVDMFPYTKHVETVVLLQKLNS